MKLKLGIALTAVAGVILSSGNFVTTHADHIALFFTIVSGLSPIVYYLRGLNKSLTSLRDEIKTINENLIEVKTLVNACPFCTRRNGK